MKVTINKTTKPKPVLRWEGLPAGTVVKYNDGVLGIKFDGTLDKKAGVLLVGDEGSAFEYPARADWHLYQKFKVVGTLSEIIVEGV